MNGPVRRDVTFSEHASVSLFECLVVTGAPATGLLQGTAFKQGETLQITLQLLRNMWQRADTLYIPRADLESLHNMECRSAKRKDMPIPDQIANEARKLSRYYIYLLFRYCISSAAPTYNREGYTCDSMVHMSQRAATGHATIPILDIPCCWLDSKACTNYPSAPPIPDGNLMCGLPCYPPQQPLRALEHQWYAPQQQLQQQQQLSQRQRHQPQWDRECQRDMDYTQQRRPESQRQNKQLYPQLPELQSSEPPCPKPVKEPDDKRKTRKVFSKGCYDSTVDSEDGY